MYYHLNFHTLYAWRRPPNVLSLINVYVGLKLCPPYLKVLTLVFLPLILETFTYSSFLYHAERVPVLDAVWKKVNIFSK